MKRDVIALINQDHREFERLFQLLLSGAELDAGPSRNSLADRS